MRRTLGLVSALTSALLVGLVSPATAAGHATRALPAHGSSASHGGGSVQVGGSVTTPTTLTAAQIGALPQATLPLQGLRGEVGSVSGASVLDVLAPAGPVFGTGKNAFLRAFVTVARAHGPSVTFAYGELDPGFGNHPALLTVNRSRVDLVVPGDRTRLRSVLDVTSVTLALSLAPVATPAAGSVQVTDGRRTVTLSASLLRRLPSSTVTVTFQAGSTPQTHTETGPSLAVVELAAGFLPAPNTVVTAVGSDGYAVNVTNGEDFFGGRPLLVSLAEDGAALAQPRLVVDGDVKGGRYVSLLVNLALTR